MQSVKTFLWTLEEAWEVFVLGLRSVVDQKVVSNVHLYYIHISALKCWVRNLSQDYLNHYRWKGTILTIKTTLDHPDKLPCFLINYDKLYKKVTTGLLTSAAFCANSFLILAFSMLSWASLFFLSSSILFLSSSCLCFSISANFPFTLPEHFTKQDSSHQPPLPSTYLIFFYYLHLFACLTFDFGDVRLFHLCRLHLFFLITGGE